MANLVVSRVKTGFSREVIFEMKPKVEAEVGQVNRRKNPMPGKGGVHVQHQKEET